MAGELVKYRQKPKPSALLNSLFMSTVNVAAKTLVSVASKVKVEHSEKWRASDHLRFMVMLMSWLTVWVLRVLMDHFPCPMSFSPHYLLQNLSSIGSFALALPSSATALSASTPSMDLILQDDFDGPSVDALGRALTHVLALLNDIPATSRKYQFAMAMADRIMDGNFRNGHVELAEVNRTALSSAFSRTLNLLYRSLQHPQAADDSGAWTSRVIRSLPLGSYIASYVKGLNYCVSAVLRTVRSGSWQSDQKRRQPGFEGADDVVAEKLAQELLWITNKLRTYGAVDEALAQWSSASGLASLSLTANPRVQGFIVRISALLIGDLSGDDIFVSREVRFGVLVLWIPLFCYANNGLAGPYLSSFEKMDVERAIDEVMSTLPAMDQEVILTNWVQDFAISASEWPNLQVSHDRWCQCTRQLAA